MPNGLRAGLSFGIADGRAIFLDAIADRYFCYPPTLNTQFLGLMNGEPVESLDPRLQALLDLNVTEPLAPTAVEPIIGELMPAPPMRWRPFRMLVALFYVALAQVWLKQGLATCLARLERHRLVQNRRGKGIPRVALTNLLEAFESTRFVVTAQDQCLSRSIALNLYLAAFGYSTDLVIGVRPRPFAAHCWVQAQGQVINDTADTVRAYVPVRVV